MAKFRIGDHSGKSRSIRRAGRGRARVACQVSGTKPVANIFDLWRKFGWIRICSWKLLKHFLRLIYEREEFTSGIQTEVCVQLRDGVATIFFRSENKQKA